MLASGTAQSPTHRPAHFYSLVPLIILHGTISQLAAPGSPHLLRNKTQAVPFKFSSKYFALKLVLNFFSIFKFINAAK
jgi:hypothetical protein